MTEQLRQAFERIEKLPDAAQNEVAARLQVIAEEMAERHWDELFADPRSDRFFDQMSERYEQAKRTGDFRPLPSMTDEI